MGSCRLQLRRNDANCALLTGSPPSAPMLAGTNPDGNHNVAAQAIHNAFFGRRRLLHTKHGRNYVAVRPSTEACARPSRRACRASTRPCGFCTLAAGIWKILVSCLPNQDRTWDHLKAANRRHLCFQFQRVL